MKNKKTNVQTDNVLKKSKIKKRVLFSLMGAGVIVCSSYLCVAGVNATKYNPQNKSIATSQDVISNTTSNFSVKKNLDLNDFSEESPMLFLNQKTLTNNNNPYVQTLLTQLAQKLSGLEIQTYNGQTQNLVIKNWYLLNAPTFDTQYLQICALQLFNPTKLPVKLSLVNPTNTKNITNFILKAQQYTWIYLNNNQWQSTNDNTLSTNITNNFSVNDVIVSIHTDGLSTANNKPVAPNISSYTPYQLAQQQFMTANGKNIVLQDLENMFVYMANTTQVHPLVVNYAGTVAKISFYSLNADFANATYTPAYFNKNGNYVNATLTIPSITGKLNVKVPINGKEVSLNLAINNEVNYKYINGCASNNVTFQINPLIFNTTKNSFTSTYPAIVSNLLQGTTFSFNNAQISGPNYTFGYYIESQSNTNSDAPFLNLWNTNSSWQSTSQFKLIQISFSYLFYNFWMADHPTSYDGVTKIQTLTNFGSVYDNGAVNLNSKQAYISPLWTNAFGNLNNTSQNILNTNFAISEDANLITQQIIPNLKKQDDNFSITVPLSQKLYPDLYNAFITANPWFKLNNVLSANLVINVTLTNNVLSLNINKIIFYNNSDLVPVNDWTNSKKDADAQIYYVAINNGTKTNPILNIQCIYPSSPEVCYTTIDTNINLSLSNVKSNNFDLSLNNFALNIPKTANDAWNYINAYNALKNNKSTLYIDFLNQLNNFINNKEISVSDLAYSIVDDNLYLTSFNLTNTGNQVINLVNINNQDLLPNNTINISSKILVSGLITIQNISTSAINIQDYPKYSNLLTTNFASLVNNTNNTHNNLMCNCLSNLFFNDNNNLQIVGYSAKDATNVANKQLEINTIEVLNNSKTPYYLDLNNNLTLLNPQQSVSLSINTLITGFITTLSETNIQIINQYMQNAQDWLNNLTTAQIQNDFAQMANVTQYTTNLPSTAVMSYSKYSVQISDYNPKTNSAILSNMHWNVNVKAASGISLDPWVYTSVYLQANNIPFKLVPVIFYQINGQNASYPAIEATSADLAHIIVVNKYIAVNTILNYNNIPNNSEMSNIRYGYFIEPYDPNATQNKLDTYAGDGLALALSGSGAQYKPTLNISYAFNTFVMSQHFVNNTVVNKPGAYGSYASDAISNIIPNISNINPYGEVSINLPTYIDTTKWNISNVYWLDYNTNNLILNNLTQTFNLPSSLHLMNFSLNPTNLNDVVSAEFDNDSNITYKLIINSNAYFIVPYATNQIIDLNINSNFASNLSYTTSFNLSTELSNNNLGAKNYYNATKYVDDSYAYLYPMVWTQDNDNCLSRHWYSTNYYWNETTGAQNTYTIIQKSWTSYISDLQKQETVYLSWIGQIINLPSSWLGLFEGYKVYVPNNNQNQYIVISGIDLNGTWINTNITIQAGYNFSLA